MILPLCAVILWCLSWSVVAIVHCGFNSHDSEVVYLSMQSFICHLKVLSDAGSYNAPLTIRYFSHHRDRTMMEASEGSQGLFGF